jgi:hypothetical protein
MNQSVKEGPGRVVDLASYRPSKNDDRLRLPPVQEDAEELFNEIVHHLLMAIRAITARHH